MDGLVIGRQGLFIVRQLTEYLPFALVGKGKVRIQANGLVIGS